MTIKEIEKIDERLSQTCESQGTTNVITQPYVDRTEILLKQMTFIALNNKSYLNFQNSTFYNITHSIPHPTFPS